MIISKNRHFSFKKKMCLIILIYHVPSLFIKYLQFIFFILELSTILSSRDSKLPSFISPSPQREETHSMKSNNCLWGTIW